MKPFPSSGSKIERKYWSQSLALSASSSHLCSSWLQNKWKVQRSGPPGFLMVIEMIIDDDDRKIYVNCDFYCYDVFDSDIWYFHRTQVPSLPYLVSQSVTAKSLLVLNFAQIVWFVIVVIKWISFLVVTRISLCCYMDLAKLPQGFP